MSTTMSATTWLLLVLAGGVGACTRYLLDRAICSLTRERIGIATINVLGSFLIGIAAGALDPDSPLRAIAATGFLGGFTTISTAMVDAIREHEEFGTHATMRLIAFTYGSSIVAACLGIGLGRLLRSLLG